MKVNYKKWRSVPESWRTYFATSAKIIVDAEREKGSLQFSPKEAAMANRLNAKLVDMGVLVPETQVEYELRYHTGDAFYSFLEEITIGKLA
jgi:hypothetical protein